MKNVIILEGTEKIGNHWFCDSEIESVEIPASVKEIGPDASYRCRSLRSVTFAEGSRLEKIGAGSFCESVIDWITIPNSVDEIQEYAFQFCEYLKEVVFQAGSALKTI